MLLHMVLHRQLHNILQPPTLQVSEKAHQTASEVQQKGKRITENVKQQVQQTVSSAV